MDKTIIFGIRPIIEAINSGKEIEKILISKDLRGILYKELFNLIREFDISHQFVPIEKLNRISKKNHQGTIAFISEISFTNIEQLIPLLFEQGKVPLILILDEITDIRNMGAIVRTSECAGVHAIIIPTKGSAQINSDAVKTSAGALLSFPVCKSSNLKNTIKYLKNCGLQIISATEKSEKIYYEANFTIPTVVILGSEQTGINPEYLKLSESSVKIPVFGAINSLNVSVASGIIIYEAVRQRSRIE